MTATTSAHFLAIQKAAKIGSWEWDIQSDRIWWSDEVFRIFNLDPKHFEATYDAFLNALTPDSQELVKKQASLASSAKLDGIICSGQEARFLKKICKRMDIITPGIRLKGDSLGDQKRVMSPKDAFKNGATAIVMGRSITKGNIKKNIQKLIKSL